MFDERAPRSLLWYENKAAELKFAKEYVDRGFLIAHL